VLKKRKKKTPRRFPRSYSKVLVSFFTRIISGDQPLTASGEVNALQCSGRLKNLGLGRRRQLGAEDAVPEAAGDAEAVLVVGEVVLEVVLLECVPVGWETVMVVSMCI
jgi:hypothetical protein